MPANGSLLGYLAERKIRGIPAVSLCNIYGKRKGNGNLYLFVDSSRSMSSLVKRTQMCAAGVAISALKAGYSVSVINYSDKSYFHKPTKNKNIIFRAITKYQGKGTKFPSFPQLDPSKKADFVFVSDGVFFSDGSNLEQYSAPRINKKYFFLSKSLCYNQLVYNNKNSIYSRLRKTGFVIKKLGENSCVLDPKAPPS